jgi:uncharacterized protein YdeI (YjbR/CyaY-like superfamily)
MQIPEGGRTFNPASRAAWRKWLATNESPEPVWLVLYRKSSKKHNLTYADAVEEALCYGWIDNRANPRDDESSYLRFTPRKPESSWSKLNIDRANRLIRLGLMTNAGLAFIDIAKKTGKWKTADRIPPDLKEKFERNKRALQYFQDFPPYAKRMIIQWIIDAKRPETRAERIRKTVELAAKNIKSRP